MSLSLKHMKQKMNNIISLYLILLYAVKFCSMKNINLIKIKPLANIIAKELDELSTWLEYF